jgi:ferredoxin-NADP reductase
LVAILYGVTQLRFSPEKALLAGNLLAFLLEPSKRYKLSFVRKQKEADGIYSFVFRKPTKFKYKPGQYLEWTLPMAESDSRGNRRYFTVSSSPSEKDLMLSIRLPEPASSFKRQLSKYQPGDTMLVSHLSGSFTLPKNAAQKVALLAGGIGVTPFRSFIKSLIDSEERRDAILIYSANQPDELAFRDLLNSARSTGLKAIYTLTDTENAPKQWGGHRGFIDKKMVKQAVPDYKERLFYISGPYGFVQTTRRALAQLGVANNRIVTDYFPGYG